MAKLTRETKDGIYSLMLTPYKEDLSIDYDTYEEYAEWQVSQGVEHLFAVCGSSEMRELSLEERLELADPEIVKQGGHFGVRLKASAPSIHIMCNKPKFLKTA